MISFRVDVRDTAVLATLRNGAKRQRYAISNAINSTLLAIQASVPAHMQKQGFVVRKKQYFFGGGARRGGVANNISDFAKPVSGKLFGRIDVRAGNVNSNRRLLLKQFEHGGTRRPMTPGAKNVAVPLLGRPARPNVAQGVPPQYSFAGLRFRKFVGGKKVVRKMRGGHKRGVGVLGEYGRLELDRALAESQAQWKGQQRTFILNHSRGTKYGGVFQRIGPGRAGVRLLYAFVHNPQLPATLEFEKNAKQVANVKFRPALLAEVRKSLDFHASGGGRK